MNTAETFNLGIDLAQDSFEAALAPKHPESAAWRDLPHVAIDARHESKQGIKELKAWIRKTIPRGKLERIVVESTGIISQRFATALSGKGLPEVAIVNPRRTKSFGDSMGIREKTDRIDAAVLAIFAAQQRPKPRKPRTALQEKIRATSRLREEYSNDLTAWKNRLHNAPDGDTRKFIKATIKHLEKQIERLEKDSEKTAEEIPDLSNQVKSLQNIPGYGRVLAMTLSAECGLLSEYSRTQIVAVNGVYPKHFDSGKSVHRRPRLAKGGGGRVRRVLYMSALSLFHSKGPARRYIDDLEKRGLSKMCIVGVLMRKLLLVGRAVMQNGGRYEAKKFYQRTN